MYCSSGLGIMCSSSKVAAVIDEHDKKGRRTRVLKVGLICGGPSAKRGIYLHSARLVLDHIQTELQLYGSEPRS
ncbi:hypothetical protein CTI12_AA368020 [Artemisia annua]|uniref:Uncharacterized protein n=1 Tax=Artemisia annua TaxID=35608 RepID=A0A2U1MKJ5_ARTAN|nr:hypothetical protein CTI12_AA368020 [Artemisia annua]